VHFFFERILLSCSLTSETLDKKFIITIADDDFEDQQLLEAAVKEAVRNCHVNSVYNGTQLMNHLEKVQTVPDLIFLDINMPGTDGLLALKQLNQKISLSVPVCILTTSNSEKDMKKALELGAVAFYNKPAKYSELLEIVKTVCRDCIGLS
jgi:CheY-like chemotaxis protein